MTTFSRTSPGVYDASTGTWSAPSTTTIGGSAVMVKGNPERYAALGLILTTMPTLVFTPTSYNLKAFSSDFVLPGDTVVWNSATYTVKDVDPIAPDGFVIAARIVIGK